MSAVLCDVDGTLVDTTFLHTASWWQALSEAGHRVRMVDIHGAIGMGADRLLPHLLGRKVEADEAAELSDRHGQLFRPHWNHLQPFVGASELLRACAKQGLAVVLASSADPDELAALRTTIGADDAITAVTSAGDVDSSKPAPDLVHRALEIADVAPSDAVFVGDAVWDIVAAHAAGVPCIALTCGGTCGAELAEAGADAIYADPAALLRDFRSSPLARLA